MDFVNCNLETEIYAHTISNGMNQLNYNMKLPSRRLKMAVYTNKLEELSLTIRCMLSDTSTGLLAFMNRCAVMNGMKEVNNDNAVKVYDKLMEDYRNITIANMKRRYINMPKDQQTYIGDEFNIIRSVAVESITFLKAINKNIADLQVCIKGGEASPKFNKTSYKEISQHVFKGLDDAYNDSGYEYYNNDDKAPETREFFTEAIKKLKMLKTTYLKYFNKYFGDESPYKSFELYSKYICKYLSD